MDLEFTRLGEKVLNEDCDEAWHLIDQDVLIGLTRRMGKHKGNVVRVLKTIKGITDKKFPIHTGENTTESSQGGRAYTDLQALLVYESFEPQERKSGCYSDFRNFDKRSAALLEAYLVERGLIKKDSCEFYEPRSS